MNGIQVLLITGVLILSFYYALRLRSAVVDLLILTLCSGFAVYFILFPSSTNNIAHQLGVGRGADLLFYVCILLFLFVVLKLFARIKRLEKTITDVVRRQAKEEGVFMQGEKENS